MVAAFVTVLVRLGGSAPPAPAVLTVAALLRLCLLPLPPTLSDDIYRYLWDGRIASHGRNPYFHAPQDPALLDLRSELWERVAHREVETVYPPLAIAAFSIAARSPRPVMAWKAMLAIVDLLSCALLLRLARARGAPSGRSLAYAWNPLVVLEVAGMGHVDALGVLPLLAAALFLVEGRSASADAATTRRRSLAAGAAPWVKDRLEDLKQATGRHDFWNRFYPYVYPQLLAKALLAVALGAVVVTSLRRQDPIDAAFLLFAAVLVLSATVYPWYALWMLPWAALQWRLPWIVLSLTLLASYLPRLLDVPLLPWPFLLVWAPLPIALWWTRRAEARARTARRPAPPIA